MIPLALVDPGPWLRPAEAAPKLGFSAREVREMCQCDEIEHREKVGPNGVARYLISEQAIRRYIRDTTVSGRAS